jgi:NADP-dependent 3-hydroxy acid dehydrogenase YdfG
MEFTPVDAPVVREKRRPARESGLRGKVVVITGAVAGIGRATALRFAEERARIAAWDVSAETAPQLESEIKMTGGESHFQAVDVTNAGAVETAAAAVVERWGRIDVLINNAGIVRDAQLVKWNGGSPESIMSEDVWDSVIGVNLKGVFLVTRAVVPHMIKGGGGVILSAASVVGLLGNFGQTNYVGPGIGQVQDSCQCRRSGIYCDRHGEGDAHESPRSHGGTNAAGTSRNIGRRGQHILLAGFGPGKLRSRGCDFRGRRRRNRNMTKLSQGSPV